jgi:hypothetical protein
VLTCVLPAGGSPASIVGIAPEYRVFVSLLRNDFITIIFYIDIR